MAQQFPFMRLPLELRFLLDSVIEPTARHPGLVTRNGKEQSASRETDVVLHMLAVPVGILATCRQLNAEATPFINRLKKEVFRSRITIESHWNRPELSYYVPLIVPLVGPQLTNKLLHEHVQAAFPGSDAFSQRAICQLMLRSMMNRFLPHSAHDITPGVINCRVVYIHEKDETHGISGSMAEAYMKLERCLNYVDYRKLKLFRGEKDPGKATVAYGCTHVMINVGGSFDAFRYAEVIKDGTRMRLPMTWG